jgi:hypothetical protein
MDQNKKDRLEGAGWRDRRLTTLVVAHFPASR